MRQKYFQFFLCVFFSGICFAEENSSPQRHQSVHVMTGRYGETHSDLQLLGESSIELQRQFSSEQGWNFNLPWNARDYEDTNKDHPLLFEYDADKRLVAIKSRKADPMAKDLLRVHYLDPKTWDLTSEDGRHLIYQMQSLKPYCISSITSPDSTVVRYEYGDHPHSKLPLITRRDDPEGGYLINEYYEGKENSVGPDIVKIPYPNSDFRIGRVKLQKAPLGSDSSPVIKNRFFYEDGVTTVYDALNHKTVYRYNDQQQVTHREHYLTNESGQYQLYRSERFFWEKIQERSFMIAQALLDGQGNPYLCRTYTRDKAGRVIKESLYGEITGKKTIPLTLSNNGLPVENGVEHWDITFAYQTEAPFLLLSKTNGHGTSIHYRYHPKTHRIVAKFLMDQGRIQNRHFYVYNDAGQVIEQIIDDGSSEANECLTNVTQRRRISFIHSRNNSSSGASITQEEHYWDPIADQEGILKKSCQVEDWANRTVRIDTYDAAGNLCSWKQEMYDLMGRLISSIDDKDQSTSTVYNKVGKPVSVRLSSPEGVHSTTHTYDFAHRLIRTEEIAPDGSASSLGYRYDLVGNCIAAIDVSGNETEYRYDSLGRLLETIYPAVLDEEGIPVRLIEKREYDLLNRVTAVIDPKGQITKSRFNICGKLLEKHYPDGTYETWEYAIDGVTLIAARSRDGMLTKHYHDAHLRVVASERYDTANQLISRVTNEYNAFHLAAQTEADGAVSSLTYNAANQIVACTKQLGDKLQRIEYSYDSQGNEILRKEWFGKNAEDYLCYKTLRDVKGAVIEVRMEDGYGGLLKVEHPKALQKPNEIRNPFFCNERGQCVLQTCMTDSSGRQLITTYDALHRPELVVRKNSLGKILTQQEMRYDRAGNKVSEKELVFKEDQSTQSYTVKWKYGPGNRLEGVVEAADSPQQTVTSSIYNSLGQLTEMIKPDGVRIVYTYDPAGRLLRLSSSDHSILYCYLYDNQGRIVAVIDELTGGLSEYTYGSSGEVVYEKLANGLSLAREYDVQGRVIGLTLPDASKIAYDYNVAFMKSVSRISSSGSRQYTHDYTAYDLQGKIVKENMIENLGEINSSWDRNRLVKITSPYATSQIPVLNEDAAVMQMTSSVTGTTSFGYDDLQQLVQETSERGDIHYSYDSLGNRLSKDGTIYTLDSGNRVIAAGDALYHYDRNGCLLKKVSKDWTETYSYDALNRLIGVNTPKCSINYTYDAWHRKQCKFTLHHDTGIKTQLKYIHDGDREIGCIDEDGEIIALRLLGIGQGAERGAAVAIELKGHVYAPLHDVQGSISGLVDLKSKKIVETYSYTAFGETQVFDKKGQLVATSLVGNPWGYCGKRHENEIGVIDFGKRFYDPELGRWMTPDPLGTMDGINRYAYVKNNPLNAHDLYGLYSLDSMMDTLGSWYTSISGLLNSAVNYLKQYSFNRYIEKETEQVGIELFGAAFLITTGYYVDDMKTGVFGNRELNDTIRITAIHGMLNAHYACLETMEMLSQFHGGMNVHYVFYPTRGWGCDLLQLILTKFGYVPPQAKLLADTWKQLIAEMGGVEGGGKIVHYAHSLGGTITLAACDMLTPEERKMIHVIAIGSTSVIPNNAFGSVVHYVSYRDGVFFADPFGYLRSLITGQSHVNWVGTSLGIPLLDHLLTMETYQQLIETLGREFLANHWNTP